MSISGKDFSNTFFPEGDKPIMPKGAKQVKTVKDAIEHSKGKLPEGDSPDKIDKHLRVKIDRPPPPTRKIQKKIRINSKIMDFHEDYGSEKQKGGQSRMEERSKALDEFAKKDYFTFDNETGKYASYNPFGGDRFMSIDQMKEEKQATDDLLTQLKALEKGYKPIIGMEGLFQNDKGDVKIADEF